MLISKETVDFFGRGDEHTNFKNFENRLNLHKEEVIALQVDENDTLKGSRSSLLLHQHLKSITFHSFRDNGT